MAVTPAGTELANAATLVRNQTFRDQCLAALVNKANTVAIAFVAVPAVTPAELASAAFSASVRRQSPAWAETAAWAVATDPTVYVQTAPTEALILTAVTTCWARLAAILGA